MNEGPFPYGEPSGATHISATVQAESTVAVVIDKLPSGDPYTWATVEPGKEIETPRSSGDTGRVAVMTEEEVDAYLLGVFGSDYEQHERGESDE